MEAGWVVGLEIMEIQETVAAVVTVSMARLALLLLVTTDFLQELLRL